jgi:hypothetical protein
MVAPPQQRLYFFPDPHGHGSFRPILSVVYEGSGPRVFALGSPCCLKYRYAPNSPADMDSITFSHCSGSMGLGRMARSSSCSW